MRIAAALAPVASWPAVLEAAKAAERAGLDAIGFWDHYQSPKPEFGYISGWSVYGAVATATERIRLVPMVLNNLHYQVGVVAKESSMLAIASAGRFELGIGSGDWPESYAAWGEEFPKAADRLARLAETVAVLRMIWTGRPVTFAGKHLRLLDAICTPQPPAPPRVVVGVANSPRTLAAAAMFADELNVYNEAPIIERALATARGSPRTPDVSVFVSWDWDNWPRDVTGELSAIAEHGIRRVFVSIGGQDMPRRIEALASAAERLREGEAD
jgi:alkanesulfonate monooxygenase SsuD/methylene tetrahydromethanopterin reductase-like flavin-dependent oxidoreductase (luciferase family)